MNLRYRTVRIGPGRRLDDAVSELIVRTGRDVSRLGFSLADAVDEVEEPQPEEPKIDTHVADAAALAAEQMRLRLESSRAEGFLEGRRHGEAEFERRLIEERRRVDRLRIEFASDRQRFFASAESQVVLLALAIANRVLHREVLADGLHLRATVKAALARVQDGSSTILRVPEAEAEAWAAMFDSVTSAKVEIMADDRMAPGECSLQTNVGTVEMGVEAQMEEITRGFGELMHNQDELAEAEHA
jgi:flagellar assembly protein FliH